MVDRLSSLDASFLYIESPTTPMHVGGVALFEAPSGGFDYDRLAALVADRIGLVPRYRQKIRNIPGNLARPVWVDDEDFDISYHIRRSALPRPGTERQLHELVARLQSRLLDHSRPLWEMYLVEGLAGNRFAIVTKTHHAMVDGASAVDIGQLMLDVTPDPHPVPVTVERWSPAPAPASLELVGGALAGLVRTPQAVAEAVVDATAAAGADARHTIAEATRLASGLAAALRTTARGAPSSPLNADIGAQRRYGTAATRLDDYRLVRKAHGGTVNDVVLAAVTGALRSWLLFRGEPVGARATVRAMVPVSLRSGSDGSLGNRVSSFFVDLPVGEGSPVVRLAQVSYQMKALKESGQSVGAESLVALSGFAPPTLHSLGARAAASLSRRVYNLVVTNVPGPQFPLYALDARMEAAYPVVPLAAGQAVSIGLTSYDGGVYFGLNADRDAMPDVDVLAELIEESLAELVETVQ